MFYVYQYLREDLTPYYIGKGKGKRAWTKGKREHIHKPIDPQRIEIIKDHLTESEAHSLEMELIAKYGRKDIGTGILQNKTNGGEGTAGAKFGPVPEERRQKISQKLTGRTLSDETKKKLSASHTGLQQSDETKKKRADKLRGIVRTDEFKQKGSLAKLGEKNPMFGKESPFKGKTHSPEMKQHIKEMRAKQVFSEETKAKMAESQRRRHAGRKAKTSHDNK